VHVAQKEIETTPALLERLADARLRTDALFELVRPDSLYERPIPERHRIIFYLGHLEAFDWNLLRERVLGLRTFHPDLDRLFAFGIDPVSGALPSDKPLDWPSVADARRYVKNVREGVDLGLGRLKHQDWDLMAPGTDFSATILLNVAIEHRLMHAETLAYMLHQLPLERKVRVQRKPELMLPPVMSSMIEVPAGQTILGLPRSENGFGWDNEFEALTVDVPAFAVDKYKVTNAQYLKFMAAGGYENSAHWTDEDWNWRSKENIRHPVFWKRSDDRWLYHTMFDEIPLPMDWPAYVSHAEASAYARWVGKSLPTEAQWHRAAYADGDRERLYPWGSAAPDTSRGNFDFRSWDPVPVNAFPTGMSSLGVADLLGNGWEWTSTVFGPLPGFKQFSFYPGYSADFFDGKHYVIKGASPRTAACMLRRSFRNWFQPRYQYVYAGFRCVSS